MRFNTQLVRGLILLVMCLLMASTAVSAPFAYTYMGTYKWVPGTGANQMLLLTGKFLLNLPEV